MTGTMSEPGQSEMADSDEQSVTLDPAKLGGKEYNAGDTIMLKVVGHTSDGMLQAVCQPDDKETDNMAGFDEAMAPPSDDTPKQPDSAGGY